MYKAQQGCWDHHRMRQPDGGGSWVFYSHHVVEGTCADDRDGRVPWIRLMYDVY